MSVKHFYIGVFIYFVFVACSVKPTKAPQNQINRLSSLFQSLNKQITPNESLLLSKDIFQETTQLTKAFKLTSPPLWHNTLVGLGIKEKGLCYHWSDALYLHLLAKNYTHFEFHLVGANIGEYFFEHNALVVLSHGSRFEDGILIDPWRNSGKVYFCKIGEDKKYQWSHRRDRGCKR